MSWSVSCLGKPSAVKSALAKQFEAAKRSTASVPDEQKAVEFAEQIANLAMDFLVDVPGIAARVSGGGSAYKSSGPPTSGSFGFKLEIEQLYGFVSEV